MHPESKSAIGWYALSRRNQLGWESLEYQKEGTRDQVRSESSLLEAAKRARGPNVQVFQRGEPCWNARYVRAIMTIHIHKISRRTHKSLWGNEEAKKTHRRFSSRRMRLRKSRCSGDVSSRPQSTWGYRSLREPAKLNNSSGTLTISSLSLNPGVLAP